MCVGYQFLFLVTAESSFDYYKRGYVFKTPNLRRLALGYLGITSPEYNLLLAGLTNLTHLDLSNSFDVDTFEFYHLVPNLVSLTLYNVKVNADPKSFVKNISQLKNLRYILFINIINFIIYKVVTSSSCFSEVQIRRTVVY